MAEVSYTATRPQAGGNVVAFTISGLTDGDTSDVIDLMGLSGISGAIQVTAATGGAVTAQVSNDGSNWETLTDANGNDVTVASGSTGIFDFSTASLKLRLLGGASLTDGDAVIVLRDSLEA